MKQVSEITPVSAVNPVCPFNCNCCVWFGGIVKVGDDVFVECDLENNED